MVGSLSPGREKGLIRLDSKEAINPWLEEERRGGKERHKGRQRRERESPDCLLCLSRAGEAPVKSTRDGTELRGQTLCSQHGSMHEGSSQRSQPLTL